MSVEKEPCKYCESENPESMDSYRHELLIETCCIRVECESYTDEYIPIKYCPMCGRKF